MTLDPTFVSNLILILTGFGGAFLAALWIRTNQDQPLLLTTLTGAPIYMRPGITFYEVLGAASYVDQDAGEWNFHHSTP